MGVQKSRKAFRFTKLSLKKIANTCNCVANYNKKKMYTVDKKSTSNLYTNKLNHNDKNLFTS